MAVEITAKDYADYIRAAAEKIAANGDYITGLDAATGDGDHWVNINMGFQAMAQVVGELESGPLDAMFKKLGMLMMNKVGGSSGILYGGAYLAAAKSVAGKESMTLADLGEVYESMVEDMMTRGKAQPGFKTMIDTLYPAAQACKAAVAAGLDDREVLERTKQAAVDGAESTRGMEAVKGRASYQTDKGVGHLDPGAVTMSYQIECLCDCMAEKLT